MKVHKLPFIHNINQFVFQSCDYEKAIVLYILRIPEFSGIGIIQIYQLLNSFVRLAGDHLYGKLLFTWLSLVMSMMVSFCAVLFPTRCLG